MNAKRHERSIHQVNRDVGQHLLEGHKTLQQTGLAVNKFSAHVSELMGENQKQHEQLLRLFQAHEIHLEKMSHGATQIANTSQQMEHQYKVLSDQLISLRNNFENYRRHRSNTDGDRQGQINTINRYLEQLVTETANHLNEQIPQLQDQLHSVEESMVKTIQFLEQISRTLAEFPSNFQDSSKSLSKSVQSLEQINRNLVTLSQKLDKFKSSFSKA